MLVVATVLFKNLRLSDIHRSFKVADCGASNRSGDVGSRPHGQRCSAIAPRTILWRSVPPRLSANSTKTPPGHAIRPPSLSASRMARRGPFAAEWRLSHVANRGRILHAPRNRGHDYIPTDSQHGASTSTSTAFRMSMITVAQKS